MVTIQPLTKIMRLIFSKEGKDMTDAMEKLLTMENIPVMKLKSKNK